MFLVKLTLKLVSWIALIGGALWSGALAPDDIPPPLPPVVDSQRLALPLEEDVQLEIRRAGSVDLALAWGGLNDSALLRADQLLEEFKKDYGERQCRVDIRRAKADMPSLQWAVPVSSFAFSSGGHLIQGDASYIFLARTTLSFKESGPCRLGVTFAGPGPGQESLEPFDDLSLFLFLGAPKDETPEYHSRDARPGLLLLGGCFGAFIHLFLLLIHRLIPLREELPLAEDR